MAATYRRLLGAALGAALLLAGCAGAPPPPAAGTRGPAAPGDPESPGGGPGAGPGRVLRRPLPLRGDHPRRGGLLRAHPGAVPAGRGAPAPHRGRPVPGRPARWTRRNSTSATWSFSTATARPGAGVRSWPASSPRGSKTRCATTASTWAGAGSCTLPPGACLSAAWTPRSGGSRTAGPGAISPAAINLVQSPWLWRPLCGNTGIVTWFGLA